ncbi:acetyl-CoA acetyltransferase [Nocardioides sp. URHA0020]|uniref:acetyl-CoA acetyltransferase n=1 Tax=Nocardioides sp. URHA0020 TaxID=1380392 RepID=UPI0009DD39BF|nr:acetyl-CoA acetyltransferase [Nocardioides sp. URHA0020]
MPASDLDPRTPVLVGVGQCAERIDEPGYEGLSAVGLAGRAAAYALADAGATVDLAAQIDTIAGVRQFETSTPIAEAPLGRADNFPRAVAARIGADPAYAVLEVVGGQAPQRLVTEMAAAIATGERDVVLVAGSEAISTTRHFTDHEAAPDFTEVVGGQLEDRGTGLRGLVTWHTAVHGLTDAPIQYALFENARRARVGQSLEEYAAGMGELFAPFSEVAAVNPLAAAPTARTAEELATPSQRNRPIVDPYPRFLIARDQVNQGAAALLMSVGAARRLGVPEERWVFLHGHADLRAPDLLDREDLSTYPTATLAVREALEVAGAELDDVTFFDLYSCFPVAVSTVLEGLGLEPDDPRGFTLTGGLPFFGGAGNNYSMHAIAEAVQRCRTDPDELGLVTANGGMQAKYSVGVYSARPVPWRTDRSSELQAEIASWPAPAFTEHPEGWATIETYAVRHGRSGRRSAVVIGRLDDTGERFLAMALEDDGDTFDLLASAEPVGQRVYARSLKHGNRVSTTRGAMDAVHPEGATEADRAATALQAAEFETVL